jgi:hypothetical protein
VNDLLLALEGPTLQLLNLASNRLSHMPSALFDNGKFAASIRELYLGYNQMTTLGNVSWARSLPSLEILDLSNNRLHDLGMLPGALVALENTPAGLARLHTLKLENNELRDIPYEFGMASHLKILLLEGNPQRTIRAAVLCQGNESVLKYLQMKVPEGYVPSIDSCKEALLPSAQQNFGARGADSKDTLNTLRCEHDNDIQVQKVGRNANLEYNGESLAVMQLTAELEDMQAQFDASVTFMSDAMEASTWDRRLSYQLGVLPFWIETILRSSDKNAVHELVCGSKVSTSAWAKIRIQTLSK